jgi:hypothetical protein
MALLLQDLTQGDTTGAVLDKSIRQLYCPNSAAMVRVRTIESATSPGRLGKPIGILPCRWDRSRHERRANNALQKADLTITSCGEPRWFVRQHLEEVVRMTGAGPTRAT